MQKVKKSWRVQVWLFPHLPVPVDWWWSHGDIINNGCHPHMWKKKVTAHGPCFTGTRRDLRENTGVKLSLEFLLIMPLSLHPTCNGVFTKSLKIVDHKLCGKWPWLSSSLHKNKGGTKIKVEVACELGMFWGVERGVFEREDILEEIAYHVYLRGQSYDQPSETHGRCFKEEKSHTDMQEGYLHVSIHTWTHTHGSGRLEQF